MTIFFARAVIVQNKNSIVKLLDKADIIFIISATLEVSPNANKEKNLPRSWKSGAPGGWPTCNLNAVAIYSPQSHQLAVGSIVRK